MTNGDDGIKAKKYSNSGGGYESAGNISNVQADGTTEDKEVADAKDAKKAAYDMSQAKGSGNVKSIRENIADYLPDSAIRRRMLSKAEKKRERLDAKFGKPSNREYTSKDGNAISGDGDKMNKMAQGKSPSFLDEDGNPNFQKILRKGDEEYTPGYSVTNLKRVNGKQSIFRPDKYGGAILTDIGDMYTAPWSGGSYETLKSIPKEEMEKSKKKYIKATKKVAKGDLREARKDRRKARKG